MLNVTLRTEIGPTQPCLPPGPPGDLLGLKHMRPLRSNFLAYASQLKEQYGDAVRFRIGGVGVNVFSHPDHFREVLVEHPNDFRKPGMFTRAMKPLLGGAIGIASGPQWAHRRKLVHAALARMDMDRVAAAAVRHTRRLVLPHTGRDVPLTDTLDRVLSAASVEATLGPGQEGHLEELYELTCVALDSLAGQIMGWAPLWAPTARRRRIAQAARRFAQLTEEARQACLARGDGPSDSILAGLMEAEGNGRPGTPREVCEEAAMMFVGGKETAAPVAVWMAYLLARHPELQERAAQEVARVVGRRDATAADVNHLKLLDAAYKETLRLYPPAFMFMREAIRPTTIGGYRVPRRSMVCLFVYAAQRDARWFAAPEEFHPERFLDPEMPDFSHAFAPFGMGKRACPGGRLATVETLATLATVLQGHRLTWDAGHAEPTPSIHMGLRPPLDLSVRLECIEQEAHLPRTAR